MDLAPYGITANAVSPGSTRTKLLDASAAVYDWPVPRRSPNNSPSVVSLNR